MSTINLNEGQVVMLEKRSWSDKMIDQINGFDEVLAVFGQSRMFNRAIHISLIFGSVFIASDPTQYGYLQPVLQAAGQLINQPK